jgi:hypothetical protein
MSLLLLPAGCTTDPIGGQDSASRFSQRLRAGAGCPELFRLRNELNPHDERTPRMNDQLRLISYHSSMDTRRD